jgi:outer membrane beta-barrel protein
METRIQRLLLINASVLTALLAIAHPTVAAEAPTVGSTGKDSGQVIEPELDRKKANVPNIDSQDIEIGAYYGFISIQDFKHSPVYGATAAWHITEDLFFEATYGSAKGDKTSFEELSGGAPLISEDDRKYTYYDISLGWNILPGEVFIGKHYAFNSGLYVIAGAGNTTFAGDNAFTVNAGLGYRLLLTDWLAWRFDARDYVFKRTLFGTEETTHNLELRTGVTVFF